MKKRIIFILILMLSISSLAAETKIKTRSFRIQGGYSQVMDLAVTPVPAQTQSYIVGMPFNIEDTYVQWGTTEKGRLIANWNFLSNEPNVTLKISADPLRSATRTSNPLDYQLIFTGNLNFYDANGNSSSEEIEIVHTADSSTEQTYQLASLEIQNESYIGEVNGAIYFMFTEESSAYLNGNPDYNELPAGDYVAEVRLTLEAGEV